MQVLRIVHRSRRAWAIMIGRDPLLTVDRLLVLDVDIACAAGRCRSVRRAVTIGDFGTGC